MIVSADVKLHAPHPNGDDALCDGPPTTQGFTDPTGRISCAACIAAGVHQPTELGNMMGGYDCACGGAWMGTRGHCTNQVGEAGNA